jgi:hypothetical protein
LDWWVGEVLVDGHLLNEEGRMKSAKFLKGKLTEREASVADFRISTVCPLQRS